MYLLSLYSKKMLFVSKLMLFTDTLRLQSYGFLFILTKLRRKYLMFVRVFGARN